MKRIPDKTTMCLIAAALMMAPTAYLNRILFDNPDSPLSESSFYIRKVHALPAFDLVAGGNSRMLQALAPVAMKDALPEVRILNLGLDGACLTPQFFRVIEGKLDPTSSYPVILLGVEPGTLELYSSANRKLNLELNRSRETKWLAWHGDEWCRWFTPVRLFSAANRFAVWRHGPTSRHPLIRNEYHPDGWMASTVLPPYPEEALRPYREKKEQATPDERISLPFEEGLYEQVRAWTGRGIRVFGVRVPAHPLVQAHENTYYTFDETRVAARFKEAGGVWLDAGAEDYETYDASHLTPESATRFSRKIASAMVGINRSSIDKAR